MQKPHSLLSHSLALLIVGTLPGIAVDITKDAAGIDLNDGASWGGTAPGASDVAVWDGSSLVTGLQLGTDVEWQGIRVDGAVGAIDISGGGLLTLGTSGIDVTAAPVAFNILNNVAASGPQQWETATDFAFGGNLSGSDPLTIAAPVFDRVETYGTYLTTTAVVAFPNTTLAGFDAASGVMNGAYVAGTDVPALGYKFENDGTTATFQLRFLDDVFTKCVGVELVQEGPDITARARYAKYISGADLSFDFDTGGNPGTVATGAGAAGYGAGITTLTEGYLGNVALAGNNSGLSGGLTLSGGIVDGAVGVAFNGTEGGSFGTGDLTIDSGATVNTGAAFSLGGGNQTTRTVSINDATANIEAGGNGGEYFRTLNLTAGTVTADSAGIYFRAPIAGADISTFAAAEPSTITTGIDMTFTSVTFDVADGAAADDLIVSGIISQNTGAGSGDKTVTKNGAGLLSLTRANTYTGGTLVNAGTVKFGNTNALGTFLAGRPVTQNVVADGASVDFNGVGNATYGYTIAGVGVGGAGVITNSGGNIGNNLAQCSNLTLTGDAAIGGTGNWSLLTNAYNPTTLDLAGNTLTKIGPNTIGLASTTVTAGSLQVSEGVLTFGVTNGGTGVSAPDTTLVLDDTIGAGLTVARSSAIGSLSGGGASGGDITLAGGTLTVGSLDTSTSYDGIISGTGGLEKVGAGTLTLSGDHTYTGITTVSGGTLEVSGTIVGALNTATGTTLSPGGSAIGTALFDDDVTLAGTTVCQIDKAGASLTADLIDAFGTLTYGGTLEVTATGDTLALGDTFQLFAANTFAGGFTTLNLPALPAGLSWNADNLGVDGTLVVSDLVATPLFSPLPGGYPGTPAVTLSSDPGATIYYTEDGSTPTTSSTLYTAPIVLPANTAGHTIKAFAVNAGQTDSTVATGIYNTVDTPSWNVDNNGDWSDSFNWLNEVVPDGVGVTADFNSFPQSADTFVTLVEDRTVGALVFGNTNPFGWDLGPVDTQVLTLATTGPAPSIEVVNERATFGVPLAGTQGATKSGAGELFLNSASSLSGTFTIEAGDVTTSNPAGFGSTDIVLGTGTEPVGLYLDNRADIANDITVSGSGTGTVILGATDTGAGSNPATYGGVLTLERATTIFAAISTDRVALNGQVTGNVGLLTLTGGQRATLFSTDNDFLGDVLVTGAGTILQTSVNTASEVIPDTADVTVEAGSILQLAPFANGTETIDGLQGSGTVRSFVGQIIPGTLAIGGDDGSGLFSGLIIDGDGATSIGKVGSGTQTLSGDNTYTGPTQIDAGTLVIDGDQSAATGSVGVAATATLAGVGTLGGPIQASVGSTIAPGNSVGTLTAGADAAAASSSLAGSLAVEIDGAAADQLVIANGSVDITGLVLAFTELSAASANSYLVLAAPAGITGALGTPTGVPAGYEVNVGATEVTLDLAGSSPYDDWIDSFTTLTDPADKLPGADPDGDGIDNEGEFAFDGHPDDANDNGKVFLVVADGDDTPDTDDELILTVAMRSGASFPASGTPLTSSGIDGIVYTVQGSLDLAGFNTQVNLETSAVGTAGLPAPSAGWEYRSFALEGSNGLPGKGFLRAAVSADIP